MQRMMPSLRLALQTIRVAVVVAKADRRPTVKTVKAKATIPVTWMTHVKIAQSPSVGKMEGAERARRLRKVA